MQEPLDLELRGRRQQVDAVGTAVHRRRHARIRVDHHQQVELLHGRLHVRQAGLAVRRVAPVEHGFQVGRLVDVLVLLVDGVEPARHGNAGLFHQFLGTEARLHPVVVDAPDVAEVLPGALGQAVVAGQRIAVRADVGRALHVVVAAVDVGAAAGHADIAERQLQDRQRAHVGGADVVLGNAHAPDHRRWLVLGQHFGRHAHRRFRHAGDVGDFIGRPFRHFLAHVVHAVGAGGDVVLVFPAVLEDVPEHAPDQRDVGARAHAHIVVGEARGAGEARVDHDHLGAQFLGVQEVQHRDRVRLGRIRADEHHGLRVMKVVERVRHGAIAEGLGHAGDGGRVADARLVVAVVRAPEGRPFAQQVSLLVAVLRAADQHQRIRTGLLADLQHLVADLVDRLVPGDAGVLAVHQLHRVAQAVLAEAVLAHRGALGAVGAHVDRRIEGRLLAYPDTVADDGIDRAADRAVAADGALEFGLDRCGRGIGGLRRFDHVQGQLARQRTGAGCDAGPDQELASLDAFVVRTLN